MMQTILTTVVPAVTSFFAGGGIIRLLTLKQTKRSLSVDTEAKLEEWWSKRVESIYSLELEPLRAEVLKVRELASDLQKALEASQRRYSELYIYTSTLLMVLKHQYPEIDLPKPPSFLEGTQ